MCSVPTCAVKGDHLIHVNRFGHDLCQSGFLYHSGECKSEVIHRNGVTITSHEWKMP